LNRHPNEYDTDTQSGHCSRDASRQSRL